MIIVCILTALAVGCFFLASSLPGDGIKIHLTKDVFQDQKYVKSDREKVRRKEEFKQGGV